MFAINKFQYPRKLHNKIVIICISVIVFMTLYTMTRTAWLGDDSLIMFRSALNLLHGHGPTFNLDERVQTFSDPLWLMLISALSLTSGNVFLSSYILSFVLSILIVCIILRPIKGNLLSCSLAAFILILSKSWIDYSACGLENPLSNFLVLAAVMTGINALRETASAQPSSPIDKPKPFSKLKPTLPWTCLFFCTISLCYLSRPDLPVVMAPFALLVLYTHRKQSTSLLYALTIGTSPALLWTAFSLFYYGFPFPNTVYAKLQIGIPRSERIEQGFVYFADSLVRDPISLTFITWGCILGMKNKPWAKAIAAGCILYSIAIVYTGGDFMTGRFFTAPITLSAFLISRCQLGKTACPMVATALILGIYGAPNTILSGASYTDRRIPRSGIANERGFYYPYLGLLRTGVPDEPNWELTTRSIRYLPYAMLGSEGLQSGPSTHVFDGCALADPLLARIPAKYSPRWRIGHHARQLPTDYLLSVKLNQNLITNPGLAPYYESIRIITREPLLSRERLKEIVRMNLGFTPKPDLAEFRDGVIPSYSKDGLEAYNKTCKSDFTEDISSMY